MQINNHKGFSLIEIIITIAIIAILTAIAYPLYDNHKRKSKRSDAHTTLSRIAQAQERFFTDNDAYATTVTALRGIDSDISEHSFYKITVECTLADPTCTTGFLLVATPVGDQASDPCYALTLSSTGEKSNRDKSNNTGTLPNCW